MLLALDVGNTHVSFALFDHTRETDPLVVSSSVSCQKNRSADEYAVLIKNILDLKAFFDGYSISASAVSSVVPSVTNTISAAAEILSGSKPFIIGPGIKTGFKISINDPACLGTDIVSNVAAALSICNSPLVIFDADTANTITVVDKSKSVIGTVIMPGIEISAKALNENAELLDMVSIDHCDLPLIGKSTEQSVLSGLLHGSSLMVDAYIRNIRETLVLKDSDSKLGLIATGEFAPVIAANCRNKFYIDNALTLRGIASLYYQNTDNHH